MRDAIIGLFPGQVLKERQHGGERALGLPRGIDRQPSHSPGQKPEQHNYAQDGNALAVGTIWLRVGRPDQSLPTEQKTEQVTGTRKHCKLFISLPAGGIQTGKTCCLGRAARGRRCSYWLRLKLFL